MIKFQINPNPNPLTSTPPKNGLHAEYSTESNDEVQEVNITFGFKNDVTMVSSGFDGINDQYSMEAKWKES